jgi:hypothetical protein
MKITKRQLRRIIKEESALIEAYISMSSSGKAIANSIKGKFMRMYPDAKVGIDGRGGFITVNGKKAVDMSQATGRGMTDEEMIEKMHSVYAGKQVDDDVGTEARRGTRPGEHKLDFGKDIGTYNYRSEGANMKITKRQLRKIIKEEAQKLNEAEGWFLLNPDGSLVNSQKTRTPVWYPDEKRAMSAYDSGYGEEGAAAVALRLVSDPYAYNGSNADPRDLKYAQQARGMEVK